jgi:hypothetical protein
MFFSGMAPPNLEKYPDDVLQTVDLSLVGCTLTLSVLSKEIESLADVVGSENNYLKGERPSMCGKRNR